MSAGQPRPVPAPPAGVDLVALAGLVAPLLARPAAEHLVADLVAAAIRPQLAELAALVRELQTSTRHAHRGIGPYVPPPQTTPN